MGQEEGTSEQGRRSREVPSSVSSTPPTSFSNSGLPAPKSWSFRELPTLPSPAELSKTPRLLFPGPPLGAAACSRCLPRAEQEGRPESEAFVKIQGRREKPAPPQPGAPPHSLPSLSRSPSFLLSLPPSFSWEWFPLPPFLLLLPHPSPAPRLPQSSLIQTRKNKE